jgi:hypothetical protein
MPKSRDVRPFEPGGDRRELVRLVRRIQTLTLTTLFDDVCAQVQQTALTRAS